MRRLLASSVLAVGFVFGGFHATPARAANVARTQLNTSIPEINFSGVALNDAIDFIRDVSGANITVNWKALEEAGVAKDSPVTARLHHITVSKALQAILSEAGGGDKLGYDIDQNVINITTRELADDKMYTRVFPIEELLMVIPEFIDAPDLSLNTTSNNQAQNPQSRSSGGGGGGNNPFGEAGGKKEVVPTRDERATAIMDLIKSVIQPDGWTENGGKATMRYWNGNLIITAPRSVLEAIGGTFN